MSAETFLGPTGWATA
ncbi:Hypothetical protein PFREUD_13700 [Propionibacterium freudenreichii subsp. shermanii CIRM-BIA1]|uniref:Uncharacterized protein n=1 Tax=Propionibacterium freudenreichii subsp. shermanii (strain ATCC 9614 / DSM 4902 / CIP 103027 / NCIMB 8099 / CIRM-BIA1) TaxID=754252 RepID=D7GEC6_PROFC|nr:Hypothetical protein PFREUD_13700 [Propionibacterium freudenreichii subsp. shermanii CIRM-BIA1]